MKNVNNLARLLLALVALTVAAPSMAKSASSTENLFSTEPTTNNGKKWRIAYYEGGPYIEYQKGLSEIVNGLMKLGWVKKAPLPKQTGEETETLWKWLTNDARSDYVEFVANGHYSSEWDEERRPKTVSQIISRFNDESDLDLVIAMGTWAGKDLANDQHSVPTVVVFSSDPIAAGIIKSIEDPGRPHVHAAVDPTRYERQLRIFHEMVHFKTLGVAYEDSVDGRSYAAMDVVERAAEELGFQVARCYTVSDIGDVELEAESVKKCFHELGEKVDAIYVTQQGGIRLESIPSLVEIANQHSVATFSQAGSDEVKYGFLASLSQSSFSYVGDFNAKTIAQILNGAKPEQIEQRFEPPPKIAINLKTAEIIDFDPPIMMLGAVDEIFNEISAPQN